MIIYNLKCSANHRFEGWFQSRADFTSQQQQGLLVCPLCESSDIQRVPAASYVHTRTDNKNKQSQQDAYVNLRQLQRLVESKTENVGRAFPEQARKMHYGEIEERPIRGQATLDELQELADEGVEAAVLPQTAVPDEKLN